MKKIIIPIFLASLCIFLFLLTRGYKSEAVEFYGFSENQERQLNFDYDVKVIELIAQPGQHIKAGDPLIRVIRTSNPLRFQNIENELSLLEIKKDNRIKEIQSEIKALQSRKDSKILEIEAKEKSLISKINQDDILREVIDIPTSSNDTSLIGSKRIELRELQDRKAYITIPMTAEINALRNKISTIDKQFNLEIKKLNDEKAFYINQKDDHVLKSPSDAVVGSIDCNPGENYSSFSKLVSLYDPHPSLVKAFLLESMIANVKIGDKVSVSSLLSPDIVYDGIITGFGTKIMEIPERLRKIPSLKIYGRRVLISIPHENKLLRNEKVMIELEDSALTSDADNLEPNKK